MSTVQDMDDNKKVEDTPLPLDETHSITLSPGHLVHSEEMSQSLPLTHENVETLLDASIDYTKKEMLGSDASELGKNMPKSDSYEYETDSSGSEESESGSEESGSGSEESESGSEESDGDVIETIDEKEEDQFEYGDVLVDVASSHHPDGKGQDFDEDIGGESVASVMLATGAIGYSIHKSKKGLVAMGILFVGIVMVSSYVIWRKFKEMKEEIKRLELQQNMSLSDKDVEVITLNTIDGFIKQQTDDAIAKRVETKQISTSDTDNLYNSLNETKVLETIVEETVIESVDVPEPVMESVDVPEPVMESVDVPEPVMESVDVPEPVMESVDVSEPVMESVDVPEPVMESVDVSEPVMESVDVPELVVDELESYSVNDLKSDMEQPVKKRRGRPRAVGKK